MSELELLFFDTFSHENNEEVNLDLVQFPKPVFIGEVRVIPLGARVQADFPGGVRLGATNPSQFKIEFFVNDLSKPSASAFENLGSIEYNQNGNIHLECDHREIPTDGLVLRGWYTTITLAVYGVLTKSLVAAEPPQPTPGPPVSLGGGGGGPGGGGTGGPLVHEQELATADWVHQHAQEVTAIGGRFPDGGLVVTLSASGGSGTPGGGGVPPSASAGSSQHQQQFVGSGSYPRGGGGGPYHHPPGPPPPSGVLPSSQQCYPRHHYPWSNPQQQSCESYELDSWEPPPRSSDKHWDRLKERHPLQTQYRYERGGGGEEDSPSDYGAERDTPDYGREDYYSIHHQEQQQERDWEEWPPSASGHHQHQQQAGAVGGQLSHHQQQLGGVGPPPPPSGGGLPSSSGLTVSSSGGRKRPHTPPPSAPAPVGGGSSTPSSGAGGGPPPPPQPPPPPRSPPSSLDHHLQHHQLDMSGGGSGGGLSPGDVESISEGDIPETEGGGLSPLGGGPGTTGAADGGSEPFEPILSDEEIADDPDHQDMDYDFPEYSEDPLKSFNPYSNEIPLLKNLQDPALSWFEFEERHTGGGVEVASSEGGNLLSILDSIQSLPSAKEAWVESAEQILNLIPNSLLFIPSAERTGVISKLIEWTTFGLDFSEAVSQSQPAFKLRHLKAGIRLVEALSATGEEVCLSLVRSAEAQIRLLSLLSEEYMALSIKLMILKALDATLRYSLSVEEFMSEGGKSTEGISLSGYQRLIQLLEDKNHARVKYSMCAIICKLHFYEMLTKHHSLISELQNKDKPEEDIFESISHILEKILQIFIDAPRLLSQPKRFLPVSAQFEIGNSFPDPYKALFSYFRHFNILDDFISLLSHPQASIHPVILAPINGLISELLESNDGLKFLLSTDNLNKLIRLLLGSPSNGENEIGRPGVNPTLGLHAAYRLQALSYIDNLNPLSETDPDKPEVIDILHGMFSLTLSNVANIGKSSVVHVLSQNSNMDLLLNFLKHKSVSRKRSPSRGYICDLIVLTVKLSTDMLFFQKYTDKILTLLKDFPELSEIHVWLKPLENPSAFSYDNIGPVCDFIKNNIENCTSLPGDLIMSVRLIRYLGIPKHDLDLSPIPVNQDYTELKFKCVILQLYSLDGVAHLTTILQKLSDYYVQPALHSASLIGRQGLLLLALVHPAVQLLRRMLTYVIRVRNTEFKDLSAVPILLNIYNLMQSIPINAQAHTDALRVCREIIETLLAYTQPVSSETSTETDALNKSLWTSMISEVIKFSSNSPHNFISGLMVFSELLPLPLPLQTRQSLTPDEVTRFVSARKLWSAHLHSLNASIENMISTLGVSCHQPLLQVLRRVCLQLADLAAPSALMVVRTLLDCIQTQIQSDLKNPQLARLLNILSCLMSHGPVKAAFVSLIKGKDEKYSNLFMNLIDIFKGPSEATSQCKEFIALILQSLCDSEITLVAPSNGVVTNEVFLSNALPPKDLLILLITAMLEHITSREHCLASIFHVLRTFVLLTEHDYTYFHFKTCLTKKSESLVGVFSKIEEDWTKESGGADCLASLGVLVQLCRAVEGTRGVGHLRDLLTWNYGATQPPLLRIEAALKKAALEDESLEPLSEEVSALIKLQEEEEEEAEAENKPEQKEVVEVLLPGCDSLLTQFSQRQVWLMTDADDDRLTSAYWLSPPPPADRLISSSQLEAASSNNSSAALQSAGQPTGLDLVELAKSELPDLNLTEAVSRLCGGVATASGAPETGVIISSVSSGKKRTVGGTAPTAEASGTKRPFVAVMRGGRGFSRRGGGGGAGGGGTPVSGGGGGGDTFRSRPPNTSRPPSLHVDDFVALETCGAQPTGPTGYNKATMRAAQDLMLTRARGGRGGGRTFGGERGGGRFFGSAVPAAFQRETPGERTWGEIYPRSGGGGGVGHPGGGGGGTPPSWGGGGKDGGGRGGSRGTRNLRFFTR